MKGASSEVAVSSLVDKGKGKVVDVERDMPHTSDSDFSVDDLNDNDDMQSESDEIYSDFLDDDEEVKDARRELRLRRMEEMAMKEYKGSNNVDCEFDCIIGSYDILDLEPVVDKEEIPVSEEKNEHRYFAPNCNLKDMEWEVGIKFKDGKEFKDAVVSWAIVNGWNIKWTRSSKKKLQAECVENCRWRLYASKLTLEPTFVIRTYNSRHDCIKVKRNRQANRVWISRQLVSILRMNPDMPASVLMKEMEERFDVIITSQMCYRAKALALEEITGSYKDDYKKLRLYVLELMKMDVEGKF